jgi:archaellum component FlaC
VKVITDQIQRGELAKQNRQASQRMERYDRFKEEFQDLYELRTK